MKIPIENDPKYRQFKASPGAQALINDLYKLIHHWLSNMREIIEFPTVQKTRGDGETFWTIVKNTLVGKDKQIKKMKEELEKWKFDRNLYELGLKIQTDQEQQIKELKAGNKELSDQNLAILKDDTWPKLIDKKEKEIEELKDKLADWQETHNRIINEVCPTDEKHCTCVPSLRKEIKDLKELAIWMSGCGYDFTKSEYFIKQRDKLLKD